MASEVGLGSRPSDGQTEVSEVVSAPNDAGPAVDLSNQGQNKAVDEVLYSDVNAQYIHPCSFNGLSSIRLVSILC